MGNDRKLSDDQMRPEANATVTDQSPHNAPQEADIALPTEAQGLIGHQLRQEYKRLLSEPLPDKFTKLLEDLAAQSEPKSERKA